MKKEKWLLQEINSWQQLALIDSKTAEILKGRYSQKKSVNFIIVLFSIIGALLIGTGVILIGARNWEYFPMPLRVGIAFFPLVVSQALAVFTVKAKYESLAWRESVAVLVTASVFAAVALVGQVFHLPGDYGTYVLTCGLLSLPILFILNAASPLIVYYWTILNWAALESSPLNALILFGLFALGVLFVYLRKNEESVRAAYMTWVTVFAGFALVFIMGIMLECSLLLAALCYFVLLLSVEGLPRRLLVPFMIVGTLGGLVTTAILTYEGMWDMWLQRGNAASIGGGIMVGAMLVAASFFAIRTLKDDRLKFSFLASLLLLCVLRFIWQMTGFIPPFLLMLISNLIMLSIGVGFIVQGVKNATLLQTNVGMVVTCTLIVMRFFDSNMDFLWRGIVSLLLGVAFLLVNVKILHSKKQQNQEEVA